ncbi:hypothetical protein [Pseudomonas glycinae]|uniref:hypothetical protein n=1 Tax=Pseudomonas glycinae TaxID=1785145 RepID=UPI00167F13D2|nr:hypothetical protein [Pseudomonas glycinae]
MTRAEWWMAHAWNTLITAVRPIYVESEMEFDGLAPSSADGRSTEATVTVPGVFAARHNLNAAR